MCSWLCNLVCTWLCNWLCSSLCSWLLQVAVQLAVQLLVERFDTEFNPDFSAKSPNFRGLVLFCIEADFCTQIRILQHFSRTTRFAILCTASISKFERSIVKLFRIFAPNSAKNRYCSTFFIFFFDSRLKDPISKPFRLTENPRKRKTKTNLCYQRSRDPSAFRREAEVLSQSYGRRLTSGASVLENNVSGSGRGNTAAGAAVSIGDTNCATARWVATERMLQ